MKEQLLELINELSDSEITYTFTFLSLLLGKGGAR